METAINTTVVQKDIQPDSVMNKGLVQKTEEHTLPSIAYYPVSVLTLGLPQTLKRFQHRWRGWMRDPDPDAHLEYGPELAVNAVVIAGQVVVIGCAYYSALENLLR